MLQLEEMSIGKMAWGLYHRLIKAVIYGFRNKLECLSLNIRLGWKGLQGTNTSLLRKM